MSNEFNETPFMAGSVVGARTFRIDSLGRLTGVTHTKVFTPGENVGVCYRIDNGVEVQRDNWRETRYFRDGEEISEVAAMAPPSPDHPVGRLDCHCGYYAYTDLDGNQWHNSSSLMGLIEGYGTVTVGARGFRAGKARLLALVVPELNKPTVRPAWQAPEPQGLWQKFADFCATRWWVLGGAAGATVGDALQWLVFGQTFAWCVTALALALLTVVICTAHITGAHRLAEVRRARNDHNSERRYEQAQAADELRRQLVFSRRVERVKANYPDVPVYPSLKAAVAAHPLTTISDPSPEDEDFWTREAR